MKPRRVKLRREIGEYRIYLGNEFLHSMCLDWEKVTGYRLEEGEEVQIKINIEVLGKVRQAKTEPIQPPENTLRVPNPERVNEARREIHRLVQQILDPPFDNRGPTFPEVGRSIMEQFSNPSQEDPEVERREQRAMAEIPARILEEIYQDALRSYESLRGISREEFATRYRRQILRAVAANPDFAGVRRSARENLYFQQFYELDTHRRRRR